MIFPVVPHYNHIKPQPIEVINGFNLGFNLGNVIKYLVRAEFKGTEKQDLTKVVDYINFELKLTPITISPRLKISSIDSWKHLKYYSLIRELLEGYRTNKVLILLSIRTKIETEFLKDK